MKPFGRIKKISGGNNWKRDYHLHKKREKTFKLTGVKILRIIYLGSAIISLVMELIIDEVFFVIKED